jgi:DNA-binding IclR family transcriptional regulator
MNLKEFLLISAHLDRAGITTVKQQLLLTCIALNPMIAVVNLAAIANMTKPGVHCCARHLKNHGLVAITHVKLPKNGQVRKGTAHYSLTLKGLHLFETATK